MIVLRKSPSVASEQIASTVIQSLLNSTLECWAFTGCKREKGYITEAPTYDPTPSPVTIYVPGPGGAQVPVFGGIDPELFKPTVSPAPSNSLLPSLTPSLPPGVISKQTMASYYCGKFPWSNLLAKFDQCLTYFFDLKVRIGTML